MNSQPTQTDSVAPPPPIVCWLGLDWADQKHCISVRTTPRGPSQRSFVEQKPEVLDEFFLGLRAQHPQGRIAVAIEQSHGPALYALLKYDFLVIYPVNPRSLADYRRAFNVSGAKDDPRDADLLSEMVSLHADRLRALELEEPVTRQLRLLTEHRRDFVGDRTQISNQLTAALKCYYPLALDIVGESLTEKMGLEFLGRWPNLAALQKAKPAVLRTFFQKHNSRSEEKIAARLAAIAKAKPLTDDPALVQPLEFQAVRLVAQLRTLAQTIASYDERIKIMFAQHSEARLFEGLPGAGPALAPRGPAAFGTKRANFPSPTDLLCFSGVAPVQKQSGNQKVIHFRYARPLFLHQTMVEFAKCSIGQCEWAKLLYQKERKEGKGRWAAIRIIAFKWMRILWRCWQDREPYDEVRYLRGLQQHGVALYAPLYEKLPAAT
jgi:transposase